jgi:aspartate-semialdehyde dehydrogenase
MPQSNGTRVMAQPFPFSALVGQDEMRRAILIAAVDPQIGGVLVFGDRGIDMFVAGDQLLRGAALNAVRIALLLV